jgi:hypothetical protein
MGRLVNLVLCLFVLVVVSTAINYPLYKQCNVLWGNDQLGYSNKTICQAGCLMTAASMALAGTGHTDYNPKTLNYWLKTNGGYAGAAGDSFVWTSINKLGLIYGGKIANSAIKTHIDAGHVVICNVKG